jgi:hypothetical protein
MEGKARVRAKCQKCGEDIEITAAEANQGEPVTVPGAGAEPLSSSSADNTTSRVRRMRSDESVGNEDTASSTISPEVLELPADRKYTLSVLHGRASGQKFPLTKSRTTIGRADCDIVLDDPECSRKHAVIEILGVRNVVRDLGSTNGTFVNGKRVDEAELENLSEFRVGDHVFMLIVTGRE